MKHVNMTIQTRSYLPILFNSFVDYCTGGPLVSQRFQINKSIYE